MAPMFGINGTEMIILVVVVLLVVGPKRLPEYAQQLRDLVRSLKRKADEAKADVKRDLGDDFSDVDWRKLDPRQYDPRRIVREALMEEEADSRARQASAGAAAVAGAVAGAQAVGAAAPVSTQAGPLERFQAQAALRDAAVAAPFDPEAT